MNPFAEFSQSQLQDMYFYYAAYRDKYCRVNETCAAEIGIVEFYLA